MQKLLVDKLRVFTTTAIRRKTTCDADKLGTQTASARPDMSCVLHNIYPSAYVRQHWLLNKLSCEIQTPLPLATREVPCSVPYCRGPGLVIHVSGITVVSVSKRSKHEEKGICIYTALNNISSTVGGHPALTAFSSWPHSELHPSRPEIVSDLPLPRRQHCYQ